MYQKPDFIKVSVKASDVFAAYGSTGCPQEEGFMSNFTQPCKPSDPNYVENHYTLTGMGLGHMCYSTLNA